jgi:hypothetical protein
LARRPESAWRWPNFSPAEIACRGTDKLLINAPELDELHGLLPTHSGSLRGARAGPSCSVPG